MPWSVETYGGHGHQYLARLNETARFVHRLGVGSAELASVAAIERVYRERFTSFLRLGYALLGNREQARDAVQEAFAFAIRSRSPFHGNGSLEGWLWMTMLNVCRQEHRRRLRFSDDQPPEVAGNGRPPQKSQPLT